MAKMRLSEAILAGSTLIHPKRAVLFVPNGNGLGAYSGCALGMAGVAVGAIVLSSAATFSSESLLNSEFPVLQEIVSLPCSCFCKSPNKFQHRLSGAIIHLFDNHVMSTSNTWTLEQLVDWVREIENVTEENDQLTTKKKEEFAEMLEVMSV